MRPTFLRLLVLRCTVYKCDCGRICR